MKLNTVTPDEMRKMLYLSAEGSKKFISAYFLFESVRTEIRKILGDSTVFPKEDKTVQQARVNFWIFDRIFNGPWEYTDRPTEDEEFEDDPFARKLVPVIRSPETNRTKRPSAPSKAATSDILGRTKNILLTRVDSGLLSNILSTQTRQADDQRIRAQQAMEREAHNREVEALMKKKKVIDTWSPIIAIYGRAKQILLANEAYNRAMNTDIQELEELIAQGRFHELIDPQDHKKLNDLIAKLSTGHSYKNEVLRIDRTERAISWNSIGNPESGSLRIGRDVTHGDRHSISSKGAQGFHLRGEDSIVKIGDEARNRIKLVDQRGFDAVDKAEFTARSISIDTKLRVLLTCGSALDAFWKNGPFFMNVIQGDQICGNENYANLAGISGKVPLSMLYSPEQLVHIQRKFEEGRKVGHYESEFIMQNKHGEELMLSWHRFFPNPDKTDIGANLSFGIGTTSITDIQNAKKNTSPR